MGVPVVVRFGGRAAKPGSLPPAIWRAFEAQGAWKSWTIVVLLGLAFVEALAIHRLANRPPEFVVVDADGQAAYVRRGVASGPLLQFLAERSRPPDLAVVRFTRDFLQLALGIHSATVEANWPAALSLMSAELRERVQGEAAAEKLVDSYRLSQQRTDLGFEEISLVSRAPGLLHVRATIARTRRSLLDPSAAPAHDRIAVDLAERVVTPTLDRPDGLEVVEWRLETLGSQTAEPSKAEGTREH